MLDPVQPLEYETGLFNSFIPEAASIDEQKCLSGVRQSKRYVPHSQKGLN